MSIYSFFIICIFHFSLIVLINTVWIYTENAEKNKKNQEGIRVFNQNRQNKEQSSQDIRLGS